MTIPSITPSGLRGKETRNSATLGRVELLLENGDIEQTWEIGLGAWTVGSSPQCHISISGDSSIEPRHFELTVGKRYTLAKAAHTIRIAGRVVREWLIDRTTVIDCGSRKLMVYPIGQPLGERIPITVVTQERIPEIASKLGSSPNRNQVTENSPESSQSVNVTSATADLRKELDELRDAVGAMQGRFSTASELDALDQKLEQLTNKSIAAIEEELGDKIRRPLRDEFLELFQQERPRWETSLKIRMDSLESNVHQISEHLEETIRNARIEISTISQRFEQLLAEYKALKYTVDESRLADRNSSSPGPVARVERDLQRSAHLEPETNYQNLLDESESEYTEEENSSNPVSVDDDFEDRNSDVYDSSNERNESASVEPEDSEELLEFQVDDESISLRLNRMLGEHIERKTASSDLQSKELAVESDRIPESLEDLKDVSSNANESAAHSGKYLMELDHLQESSIHSKDALRGSPAKGYEESTGRSVRSADADPSDNSTDEDSIEEYMQRLLARVRTGPGASGSATAVTSEPPKNSVPVPRPGQRNAASGGAVSSAASTSRNSLRSSNAARTATKPTNEVKSDLQALRELANSNARRAIDRSASRRQGSRGLGKSVIAIIALCCCIALFFIEVDDVKIKFGGIGLSLIIAIVWGFDTFRDVYAMLMMKKSHEQENESVAVVPAKDNKVRNSPANGNA